MGPQLGAQGVDRGGDLLAAGRRDPRVLEEPALLGLDDGQRVQAAEPVMAAGSAGVAGAAPGHPRPQPPPVGVGRSARGAGGRGAGGRGKGAGVRPPPPARRGRSGGEPGAWRPFKHRALPAAVHHGARGVAARRRGHEALDEPAGRGALDDRAGDPARAQAHHAEGVEVPEGVPVLRQQALGDELEQHRVVALERREDVGVGPQCREPVLGEVARRRRRPRGRPGWWPSRGQWPAALSPRPVPRARAGPGGPRRRRRMHVVHLRDQLVLGEEQRVGRRQRGSRRRWCARSRAAAPPRRRRGRELAALRAYVIAIVSAMRVAGPRRRRR